MHDSQAPRPLTRVEDPREPCYSALPSLGGIAHLGSLSETLNILEITVISSTDSLGRAKFPGKEGRPNLVERCSCLRRRGMLSGGLHGKSPAGVTKATLLL
jgi:hypothetical protein